MLFFNLDQIFWGRFYFAMMYPSNSEKVKVKKTKQKIYTILLFNHYNIVVKGAEVTQWKIHCRDSLSSENIKVIFINVLVLHIN